MTPGYKTTEFWVTILLIVAASILKFTGSIQEDTWKFIIAPAGAGYTLSRGIAKVMPPKNEE